MKKNLLKVLGILAGVAMMVFLVRHVGWTTVRQTMALVGWGYLLILIFPVTWIFANCMGWNVSLLSKNAVSFWTLTKIRLSGEVFNTLLPSGYLGGEPIKAKLLSRYLPLRDATASVLVAKAAQSISFILYLGIGVTVMMPARSSSIIAHSAYAALAFLAAGIVLFAVLLSQRAFSRIGKTLYRVTGWALFHRKAAQLEALDASLGTFYKEGRGQFFASVAWHGVAWLLGATELWIIMRLLGHPLAWHHAWFMSSVAQLATTVGLMVPAGVGLYEGGHYAAAVALGMPPALGISAALIRRVREAFWNVIGVCIFLQVMHVNKREPKSSHPDAGKP